MTPMMVAFFLGVLDGIVIGVAFCIGMKKTPLVVDYVVIEISVEGDVISRRGLESAKAASWN